MRRIACAVALLMTAAPASAQAATITASTFLDADGFRRTNVHVAGTAASEGVTVGAGGTFGGAVRIIANPPVTWDLSGECIQDDATHVTCNGRMSRVTADLGGGDDFISASGDFSFEGGSIAVSGGEGNDRVVGAAFTSTGIPYSFDGGPGDDDLNVSSGGVDRIHATGGAGDDKLEGTTNDDLDGGADDDVIEATEEHDFDFTSGSAAGGPGRDIMIAGQNRVPLGLVLAGGVVSLGAGDGGTRLPQATSGFEGLAAGFGVETVRLEGDDGSNELYACGGATLIGNGGDDVLDANANGDDPEDGCFTTDAPSSYFAGAGADEVRSNNLVAETVDCGPGLDTQVLADPEDTLVGCEATGVSFTSAPSGFVASDQATFSWEAPTAPPGSTFECSLDGAAFLACTSPRALTGLAQGERSFRVRVVSSGTPGPPAERRWTVDTIQPFVSFTQVPPGEAAPTDVELAWQASEPATFQCSEDGRPQTPCSSPARLVGLGPGPHSLSVTAVDRAGNVAATPAVASWVVGDAQPSEPPAPVECPQGTQATVTLGVITARALSADACFRRAPEISPSALRARGPVLVNGMRITPRAGAFTIDRNGGGGEIGTTGPWNFRLGRVSLDINTPLGLGGLASAFQQVVQRNVQILTQDSPKAFGMRVRGSIGLEFSTDNGGQTKASLNVELPNVFRGTPDGGAAPGPPSGAQGVTVDFGATASNDQGVFFSGRARLNNLWLFGKLRLRNLELAVDQGAATFRGSVAISLKDSTGGPPAPSLGGDAIFAATVEIGPDGLFGTTLRKLSVQASELSVKVHPIVFLQRLGAELSAAEVDGRPYAVLSGNAGISFGPKLEIPPLFEGEVASIDGTIRLSVPTFLPPENFSIEVEGIGKLVEFQVAQAKVKYTTPSRVEMEGKVDLTAGGFGAFAQIRTSWFDGETSQFNVEAFGSLRVPGLGLGQGLDLEAEALLSSRGYAVCAGDQDERFGFGQLWGGEYEAFLNTCDLGGFRVTQPARVAQARTFAVRRRTGVLSVAVRGGATPPKVELTGPGGARLATPDGPEPVLTDAGLVVQDPERGITWFVLRRPAAGSWTVTPLAGSAVTSVQVADPLPPVRLRVKVTGKGARRTLTWRGMPSGHRLVLNELGRGSSRVVLRTGRSRGRIKFRPAAGPGRARRLVATVTRRGLPRFEGPVARYAAARPPKLRAVSRLRRAGRIVRWRGQAAAPRYAVSLLLPDGATIIRTARKPRTTLPRSARRGTVAVTVVPLAADGRTGPAARARLRAPRGR
jgi:hypothetical protein